uniref:HU family DNA-binding protein n=3 Tax=unclassified Prevotella TaxID=2638335 RepID=A0AB33JL26_9BACT
MNNKEYIAELAQKTGYTQADTQKMVKVVIDRMLDTLVEDETVSIAGFGTFEVKKRLERVVVNPSTGQKMLVPPKLVLNFKPNAQIKEILKEGGNEDE